jgi:hypothetical protein
MGPPPSGPPPSRAVTGGNGDNGRSGSNSRSSVNRGSNSNSSSGGRQHIGDRDDGDDRNADDRDERVSHQCSATLCLYKWSSLSVSIVASSQSTTTLRLEIVLGSCIFCVVEC